MKKPVMVVGRFTHEPTRALKGVCRYCHDDFMAMVPRSTKKVDVCQKDECRQKRRREINQKSYEKKKRLKNADRN